MLVGAACSFVDCVLARNPTCTYIQMLVVKHHIGEPHTSDGAVLKGVRTDAIGNWIQAAVFAQALAFTIIDSTTCRSRLQTLKGTSRYLTRDFQVTITVLTTCILAFVHSQSRITREYCNLHETSRFELPCLLYWRSSWSLLFAEVLEVRLQRSNLHETSNYRADYKHLTHVYTTYSNKRTS
jgi:hypothetical protein